MYDALTGAAGLTSAPAASGAPARHANIRGFHTAGAEPEGRGRSTDAKARAQKGSCGGRPLDAGHGFGAEGWRRDPPRRARGVDAPATSRRLPASPAATPVSTLSRPSWAATKPKRTACPPARQHRGPQRTYRHPQPRPPATPHLRATPTRPLQRSTTRTGQVTMTVTADLEVPAASPGREEARDPCVSPAAPEEPMRRWISPCCGRPGAESSGQGAMAERARRERPSHPVRARHRARAAEQRAPHADAVRNATFHQMSHDGAGAGLLARHRRLRARRTHQQRAPVATGRSRGSARSRG